MLRKSLLFGFVFGFTMFSSFGSHGQTYTATPPQPAISHTQALWYTMNVNDRLIVDRLATDFYERSLRYAQTRSIETNTVRAYRGATPPARARYRHQRRQQWQQMNPHQQQALRNVKRPVFVHLSEAQKWPFRRHALHQLGAGGAIQQNWHQGI